MKKLNFDYVLTNPLGKILKSGHIKYSISHYIYALYQNNFIKSPASGFWQSFNDALNNIGVVAFAFANHSPQILNTSSRIGITRMLHAFGYFAFHDITGTFPFFQRINKRIWLIDPRSNQAMSFHFQIPPKKPASTYSNLFMASFSNTKNFVNQNGTFTMKIVDPIGSNTVDNESIKKHAAYRKKVLSELQEAKIFEFNDNSTSLMITIAKDSIPHLEKCSDKFSDGTIFIYVEEQLKVSNYLRFINKENLVLSLRTASLIKLDDNQFNCLKGGNFHAFSNDEIIKLKEMGFIVPLTNEYKQMQRIRRHAFSSKNNKYSYTILTTTNCNARCPYCYEHGINKVSMDEVTQKKIANLLCTDPTKEIHISWFGGEPLLNTKAINYITAQMKKRGMKYSESIVTNGLLINNYISDLKKWHISNIQITLDGVNEKYNKVKQFANERNSFERIISNIHMLISNNIPVSIRLNFSKDNYLDIIECIDFIYDKFGNDKNIKVYAHHIFNESYYLDDGTNIYTLIFKKLIEYGYVTNLEDLGLKAKNCFCFINNKNHKVIDPDGNIYLCEHITADSDNKKVGNITDGITDIKNYYYWSSSAYPYAICRNCKFIFFCQGGCKNNKNRNDESCCIPFIDAIDDIIIEYYAKRR